MSLPFTPLLSFLMLPDVLTRWPRTATLLRHLEHWSATGAVSPVGLQRAQALIGARPADRDWLSMARLLMLWLGALLAATGVVCLIAANWPAMGKMARLGSIQGLLVITVAAAVALRRHPTTFHTLLWLASALLGGLLALVGQIYQTGAHAWQWFAVWAALMLPWTLASRSAVLWLTWAVVVNLALMMGLQLRSGGWWSVPALTLVQHATIMTALNLAMGAAWLLAGRRLPWMAAPTGPRLLALTALGWITITLLERILSGSSSTATVWAWVAWLATAATLWLAYRLERRDLSLPAMVILAAIGVITTTVIETLSLRDHNVLVLLGLAILVALLASAGVAVLRKLAARDARRAAALAPTPTPVQPMATDTLAPDAAADIPTPEALWERLTREGITHAVAAADSGSSSNAAPSGVPPSGVPPSGMPPSGMPPSNVPLVQSPTGGDTVSAPRYDTSPHTEAFHTSNATGAAALVALPGIHNTTDATPLALRALLAGAAWLSALLLGAAAAGVLSLFGTNERALLPIAALLCALAVTGVRAYPAGFLHQMATAGGLAGIGLALIAIEAWFDLALNNTQAEWMMWLVGVVLALGMYRLTPGAALLRLGCGLYVALAVAFVEVPGPNLPALRTLILAAGASALWLAAGTAPWPAWRNPRPTIARPGLLPLAWAFIGGAMGCAFWLTAVSGTLLASEPDTPISQASLFLIALLPALTAAVLLNNPADDRPRGLALGLPLLLAALCLALLPAPGVALGLTWLVLGAGMARATLLVAGTATLLVSLSMHYYQLDVTLLEKALRLSAAGGMLLLLSGLLSRSAPAGSQP